MWFSCSAIGAVTRFGIGYAAQREPSAYGSPDQLAVPEFDVITELGRKGSSTLDRLSALALLSARDCLDQAPAIPAGTGVTVSTTVGSMRSTLDYSGITITDPKPWNVPPSLFPNTVMNAAAGLVAIRHGLTGPNTTLAGGKAGGIKAMSYIEMMTETALLSACLLVCAEELTAPRSAWAAAAGDGPIGEAAVALLLTPDEVADRKFRIRVREGERTTDPADALIVAGAWGLADSGGSAADGHVVDAEEMFGVVDAATFGCQILMALHLLHAGQHARVIIPFPAARKRTWAEVEL
ncbi:beta-ketoacyl synthase N-terminal-like domain-containing protein [Nocardia sp. NPDC088792]|uniref:beta-ketoacyl synthase N-terminal-like domain-containing protein n=1 Tax=Nocardia sp. NPDC088792 TaxID=3364332 RepID=UPI00380636B5